MKLNTRAKEIQQVNAGGPDSNQSMYAYTNHLLQYTGIRVDTDSDKTETIKFVIIQSETGGNRERERYPVLCLI